MRIAAYISGEPRFCEEFDLFLASIPCDVSVDWYFWIWRENQDAHYNLKLAQLVSPFWYNLEYQATYDKIFNNLPRNHKIANITLVDRQDYDLNFEILNKAKETHAQNVWLMFQGTYHVNQLRRVLSTDYDLIIKTRPDISLDRVLDLQSIIKLLDQNPHSVIVPENHWYGYGKQINDWMAIARPEIMDTYCELGNILKTLLSDGRLYHPETLLAEHLSQRNINAIRGNFSVGLRHLGHIDDSGIYVPKFGRWK